MESVLTVETLSVRSVMAMPSYDPRRPLARYSRTLLFGVGTFIALSMLILLYYRSGEDMMGSTTLIPKFSSQQRFPSDPPRAIDSPFWANPETAGTDGVHHVFLVENWNRYEKSGSLHLHPNLRFLRSKLLFGTILTTLGFQQH